MRAYIALIAAFVSGRLSAAEFEPIYLALRPNSYPEGPSGSRTSVAFLLLETRHELMLLRGYGLIGTEPSSWRAG